MMRLILITVTLALVSGCSAHTPIETANGIRALANMSRAGITETTVNCVKDIFDPHNRGSRCN